MERTIVNIKKKSLDNVDEVYMGNNSYENLTERQLLNIMTNKQRVFCQEYCSNGWNGTRAAKKAGYSDKSAFVIATENLKKPYIKRYIEIIKDNFEALCSVNKAKVIREYTKIAFSTIRDIQNTWITMEDYNELCLTNPDVLDAIESVESKVEQRIVDKEVVETKFVKLKLHSKIAALEGLYKLMGYNAPKQVETRSLSILANVNIDHYTNEEKNLLLKMARKHEFSR